MGRTNDDLRLTIPAQRSGGLDHRATTTWHDLLSRAAEAWAIFLGAPVLSPPRQD